MSANLVLLTLSVFGAGILASLSPCVYPMIPITLGYFGAHTGEGRKSKVLFYIGGQAITLTILGLITVLSGESLGFSSQSPTINIIVGLMLIAAGIFAFFGHMPRKLHEWNAKIPGGHMIEGILGALILGASSALLASPCTTPILSSILAMMATHATLGRGLYLMLVYTAGFSLLLLFLGLGLIELKHLPRSGKWLNIIHKLGAFMMVGAGAYYLSLYFKFRSEL